MKEMICPECGREDESQGIYFFCRNNACSLAHIGYTAFRLGIKHQIKSIDPEKFKAVSHDILMRYAETFKALAEEEKKERKAAWIDKYVTNQTAQIMVMSIEAHRELMELIKV